MSRIIEIISKDKRYRQTPYPSVPAFHTGWNTFLTGQHIIPGDKDRADFLTVEEMRDPSKMSASKAKKFPHAAVINPDVITMISHRRKLDITPLDEAKADSPYPGDYSNPVDFALYQYILEREYIAKSESEYVASKHYFYLLDKEAIAVEKVSKRQLRFNAEKFIREKVPVARYRDIALLLNYKIKNFNISIETMSDSMIQGKLYESCDSYPDVVLSCNWEENPSINQELFVLKLMKSDHLEYRAGAYYDGTKFLGATVPEIISTLKKDEATMAKLSRLLNS